MYKCLCLRVHVYVDVYVCVYVYVRVYVFVCVCVFAEIEFKVGPWHERIKTGLCHCQWRLLLRLCLFEARML